MGSEKVRIGSFFRMRIEGRGAGVEGGGMDDYLSASSRMTSF